VLGDDGGAIRVELCEGEADPAGAGDLLEEGVVAAATLRPALNNMAGHHGTRDGVMILVGPPERMERRADRE
jgi:hypothetical protein